MAPGPIPPSYLDPMAGAWMFDTCLLINFWYAKLAGTLVLVFKGRATLAKEVMEEFSGGKAGASYARTNWCSVEDLVLAQDIAAYHHLRKRWGQNDPAADRGEASSIILARNAGRRFATDDGVGYRAARAEALATTRTPHLLVSLVRAGSLTEQDAWDGFQKMLAADRKKLGTVPWNSRADFSALCAISSFDPA